MENTKGNQVRASVWRCFCTVARSVNKHQTYDLRNGWYHMHHAILNECLSENSNSLRAKGSTWTAMFNTSHCKPVPRPYCPLTHMCINRVSRPQSLLSPFLLHFYCLPLPQLAPVHLYRMAKPGPLYSVFLIARMFSLPITSWLSTSIFFLS